MPIYEYQCANCGHTKEIVQLQAKSQVIRCDNCDRAMDKIMSAPAVVYEIRVGEHVNG